MKLRYFGYYLREFDSQETFLYNIKPIIDAFVSSNNIELKSSFKRGDEKLYLTKVAAQKNLYYFVRTSDDDIIKRVNEQSITVGEISDNLAANEKVAFASYVYICQEREVIACASGMSCPRFDDLTDYINEMFRKVGLNNYEVNLSALTTTSSKKDLLEMEVVNSIYIDVAADRDISKYLCKKLTGSETGSLGNLRITVEPSGSNMKDVFRKIVHKHDTTGQSTNTDGIMQIGAKGKHDELKGQLMDHWLDNENNLTDSLNPKAKRRKLPDQIGEKFDQNEHLASLFNEYVSNNRLVRKSVALLDQYKEVKPFAAKVSKVDTSKGADNDDSVSPVEEAEKA
ncbi:RexA-like intracellular sensor of abortive infection system [Vibrio crassostreae]|nr:RexA-like intracellular sensor of abortive infection system [Vibrio crassostreae]